MGRAIVNNMKSNLAKLLEDLGKLTSIAITNGWRIGEHIFNSLSETQMHQYDIIKKQIYEIEIKEAILKGIGEMRTFHNYKVKNAHKCTCNWCPKKNELYKEIKQLLKGDK